MSTVRLAIHCRCYRNGVEHVCSGAGASPRKPGNRERACHARYFKRYLRDSSVAEQLRVTAMKCKLRNVKELARRKIRADEPTSDRG